MEPKWLTHKIQAQVEMEAGDLMETYTMLQEFMRVLILLGNGTFRYLLVYLEVHFFMNGDRIVGSSTTNKQITTWGLNLKPGQEGQLLFNTTWNTPAAIASSNLSLSRSAGSLEEGLITVWSKEANQHWL
jgi:hypothetical protein